jgi:methyl-accepting chemotaxis protein
MQGSSGLSSALRFEVDVEGVVLRCSPSVADVLGFTENEVVGRGLTFILDKAWSSTAEFHECWQAVRGGADRFVKLRLVGKFQHQVWVQCCFAPLLEGPVVQRVMVCCLDVTAEMMHELDVSGQVEAITRSQAVAAFAMDGTILDANQIYLDLFGYTLEEVRGKNHSIFLHEPYRSSREYADFWDQLNNGQFHTSEFKRFGKDGREVWLYATYTPILNLSGKPWKVVKYATDIRPQKAA